MSTKAYQNFLIMPLGGPYLSTFSLRSYLQVILKSVARISRVEVYVNFWVLCCKFIVTNSTMMVLPPSKYVTHTIPSCGLG